MLRALFVNGNLFAVRSSGLFNAGDVQHNSLRHNALLKFGHQSDKIDARRLAELLRGTS
jgi:hypothetical protein